MKCPKCKNELIKKGVREIQLDECNHCNGLWFEQDELRRLKDRTDKDLQWMDFELWQNPDHYNVRKENAPTCPACDIPMVAVDYGDTLVEIDHCLKCKGIWLDGGEFEKIIAALEDELNSKDVHEYFKATLEEAKEIVTGDEGIVSEWKDLMSVIWMMHYRILVENPKLADKLWKLSRNMPK